ncbi:MAG TPA: sugar phosphate isomerase/epimerase [Chitinophagaceae bacterium]|nr:sugar phosphate isomerase/epimerase [Chitinophagaceae bacterium]
MKLNKKLLLGTFFIGLILVVGCQNTGKKNNQNGEKSNKTNQTALKASDWTLGIQSWTFRFDSLERAFLKMDTLGLKYVEGFPGQKIGNGIEGKLDYHMSEKKRKAVKKMLQKHGVKMVSYGDVMQFDSEEDIEQLFKFAQAMDLTNVVVEPAFKWMPYISKMADKYKINVAIHNHMEPSRYGNPDTVLNTIKDLSSRVGACADIGHWLESGLDPVKCIKKLKGHIIELHLKDENKKSDGQFDIPEGKDASQLEILTAAFKQLAEKGIHDVPLGEGVINMPAIMKQLKKQGFKGYMFIEHEYHFKNNVDEVKRGVKFYKKEKKKLFQ